ncbi:hypothetical protein TNCV_5081861 [Trichonephila clavipes]|nr:hypothetical protein TNCV_5081861 [Trichonephila clavipes]
MDSDKYLIFLQEVLPELLTDIPVPVWSRMRFFSLRLHEEAVYDASVNSGMDVVARISIAAAMIHETPGIFERLCQSMSLRCRKYKNANGQNIAEHLL